MVKRGLKRKIILALALSMCLSPVQAFAETAEESAGQIPALTAEGDSSGETAAVVTEIMNGFELMAQNDVLELYLNAETMAIQIKDKRNGNVYSSFAGSDEGMNDSWKNFMASGVTVEYMSDDMKLVRMPFSGSSAQTKISKLENGFKADISYKEGFSFSMQTVIEDEKLSVTVDDASITEPESEKSLQNLYLYPFLGASYGNKVPGYLFIPDGCGALIRTDEKSVAQSGNYSKRVYGQELGAGDFNTLTERSMLLPAQQIYMPVYGTVLDEKNMAVASVIEDGDAYAAVEACVYGRELPVNYVTSKFIFRETYTRSLNKSGDTMVANQKQRNHMDIKVSHYFLEGDDADYSGIAKTYQDYLVETGVLTAQEAKSSDTIPMHLEILLSEQKAKMIGTKTVMMTTKEQADTILTELYDSGVKEMSTVFYGYSGDGAGNSMPTEASFSREVASASEWKTMIEKWQEKSVSLGFYADFVLASDSMGGYSKRKDIAQNMNENLLQSYRYEPVYYLAPSYVKEKFEKETDAFKKTGTKLLALDNIGSCLYSNWNEKRQTTREEGMDIYAGLKSDGLKTAFYKPCSYVWQNTAEIYDIPSDSSDYMIFTDTVPFMQMVLKGHIDYYADKSNFHADRTKEMLKMIEYGEYPSWLLTWEDSLELFDTPSSWIYTSEYSIWKDEILKEYERIRSALAPVKGAKMTEHVMVSDDVAKVVYDNGVEIIVNYADTAYTDGSVNVEPLGFSVYDGR